VITGFTSFLGEGDLGTLGSSFAGGALEGGDLKRSASVASVLAFFAGGDRADCQETPQDRITNLDLCLSGRNEFHHSSLKQAVPSWNLLHWVISSFLPLYLLLMHL